LGDLRFLLFDTAGAELSTSGDSICSRAAALTAKVLQQSDVALFLVDARSKPLTLKYDAAGLLLGKWSTWSCLLLCRSGILPGDYQLASWLRKEVTSQILLAANKCEGGRVSDTSLVEDTLVEATRLGFGEPVAISAETGG
jgi:predicted GTPase